MGSTGRPHSIPYDARTSMPERTDRDPTWATLIALLAAGQDDPLTPTEHRFVELVADAVEPIDAFRRALPPDVLERLSEAAQRMGVVHMTRRQRVLSAIAAEAQRKLILNLPRVLKMQADLAQNAKSEAVRERAARNMAAWSGLAVHVGTDPERPARTPTAKVNINTDDE